MTGSGFGHAPTGGVAPSTLSDCTGGTGLDYPDARLWVSDASSAGPVWTAGALQGTKFGSCIGIEIHTWSSTKVELTFGNEYHTNGYSLHDGDGVTISVKAAPAPVVVPSGF